MNYAIELNERQSARAIEYALRTQAQVVFELAGDTSGPLCGHIVSGDEEVLLFEVTRILATPSLALIGRYLDVQVHADQRYLFTTNVVQDAASVGPRRVAVRRPAVLHVVQRRRFWRAQLAPSSTVQLTANGAVARTPRKADLLNVGVDGLACRMAAENATEWRAGVRLDASFELPDCDGLFSFASVIRSMTPGSDGTVILGVQFDASHEDDTGGASRQALRDWLAQRQYIPSGSEVGV